MWLITTQGFYSAVEHREDPNWILVRARVRADLKRLSRQLPDAGIGRRVYRDLSADYPYRLDLSRAEWKTALAALADLIDYGNFKSAVGREQGKKRAGVYMRVWSALCALERRDPWSRWRENPPPARYAPPLGVGLSGMVLCPDCGGDGHDRDVPGLACARCYGFGDLDLDDLVSA